MVEIAGLPTIAEAVSEHDVDLVKLAELLGDEECRAFRDWLRTTDSESDEELAERFNKVKDVVANAVHSPAGKVARLATTTGLGTFGIAPGVAASAADQFLLNKLISKPGPTAFLSRLYRSVFD